jgi:pyruvate/2-oxoglutarate dehydrogenase complex dihydrolipoamide acyltransferase (E2) component
MLISLTLVTLGCGSRSAAQSAGEARMPSDADKAARLDISAGQAARTPSAAGQATRPKAAAGKPLRVLFIGNSLTYANDLPLLVQALARAAGEDLYQEEITKGGTGLDDHWQDGDAQRALERARWDVVVLQQGPSSLPESRVHLRKWTAQFADPIRKAGARPALFMVWPDKSRLSWFDDVRESYSQAAADVKGIFLPAGEAWRAAWRRDPAAPLYSFDDFHPAVAGSYAAALSIFGVLFHRPPQGLPAHLVLANGQTVSVPEPLAKLLQDAATEANQKYGRP